MSATKKKILVIRFSSIGDIVLTSPVVRCLKRQLDAEVHFLTKASYSFIPIANPNIAKVFTIQKEVGEVISLLKKERYDYVIDLHKNLRTLQVKLKLGAKSSSFQKLNYEKWLMTNFKINKLPQRHIVDRYLDAVHFLNVENDDEGLDYFIPKSEEVNLSDYQLNESTYIVFAIGAAHQTKRLPVGKMIEICNGITKPIILVGGKEDQKEGLEILRKTSHQNIKNLCGALSVHQSASLIRQSDLVVTPDTGMMHIAAAFNKKIVSVWGNTIPDFGMYPYYPKGIANNKSIEVQCLNCRPCSKIGYKSCPKGHFKCMNNQNVEMIIQHVNQITNI